MLDELIQIVPPPDQPIHVGSGDEWQEVCEALGFEPPQDLYLLSHHYGSGRFCRGKQWLEIHSVFAPRYLPLFRFNELVFRQEAATSPDLYQDIVEIGNYGWGDEGGSGGRLFWKMNGDRTRFELALTRPQAMFSMDLITFLMNAFTHKLEIESPIHFVKPPAFEPNTK